MVTAVGVGVVPDVAGVPHDEECPELEWLGA